MDKLTKKKPATKQPIVRQTKASIYRMARGNPLLVQSNQIKVADKDINLPLTVTRRLTIDDIQMMKLQKDRQKAQSHPVSAPVPLRRSNSLAPADKLPKKTPTDRVNHKNSCNLPRKPTMSLDRGLDPALKGNLVGPKNRQPVTNPTQNKNNPLRTKNPKNGNNPNDEVAFKKPEVVTRRAPKKQPKAGTVRRSLSAEYYEKNKNVNKSEEKVFGTMNGTLNKSVSFQSLNKKQRVSSMSSFSNFNERRSIVSSTPMHKNLPNTAYNRLQEPLKVWLKSRGKSLNNYHHLKCFGLHQLSEEEREVDKENLDVEIPNSKSYEDLKIPQEEVMDQDKITENIVTGAIEDLHHLIISGYSNEQCEAWLDYIRQKYKKIEEEPQYWECRAAIEQGRGNITSAVEYYKNSIIKGANVEQIDEALSHLLEKFTLLKIETENPKNAKQKRKDKEQEVRNIFKSTIIQFAIKERSLNKNKSRKSTNRNNQNGDETQAEVINGDGNGKEEKKKFVATPVRRSTRTSCGRYKRTPGKTLYNSLHEVDNSIKESMDFEKNAYLQ